MTQLVSKDDGSWVVKTFQHNSESQHSFKTIEGAAEYMHNILGVPEDDIDVALIDMASNHNNLAEFGTLNGGFIFSKKV
jgi:acyl-coenzyme A thioesterase PaaI-like protein